MHCNLRPPDVTPVVLRCFFRPILYCAYAQTAILQLLVKILTSPLDSVRYGLNFRVSIWTSHLRSRCMFQIADMLLRFRTRMLRRRLVSKIETKFRTFWPPLKFSGGIDEVCEWILPVWHRTTSIICFWWSIAPPSRRLEGGCH